MDFRRHGCWAWRKTEAEVASIGNTLSAKACFESGAPPERMERWCQGIHSETSGRPKFAVLVDYPSATSKPEVAAAELERLSGLGKVTWFQESNNPPDSRVPLLQFITKPAKLVLPTIGLVSNAD